MYLIDKTGRSATKHRKDKTRERPSTRLVKLNWWVIWKRRVSAEFVLTEFACPFHWPTDHGLYYDILGNIATLCVTLKCYMYLYNICYESYIWQIKQNTFISMKNLRQMNFMFFFQIKLYKKLCKYPSHKNLLKTEFSLSKIIFLAIDDHLSNFFMYDICQIIFA